MPFMADSRATKRFAFTAAQHLRRGADFDAVYDAKLAKRIGPIRVHGIPNQLPQTRLGLSVSTRVGNAPLRNRVKRLLREAFRLLQHDLPTGYDLVVVVMPHDPQTLSDYQRLLAEAVKKIHAHWSKRPADKQ